MSHLVIFSHAVRSCSDEATESSPSKDEGVSPLPPPLLCGEAVDLLMGMAKACQDAVVMEIARLESLIVTMNNLREL